MSNERTWPQQCWKSCANGSNIVALRFGDHGTKEMLGFVGWKVWPVSNFARQHATTSNNMQQGVQTDVTCNIHQYWELSANNVASVCTGLKSPLISSTLPQSFLLKLCFDLFYTIFSCIFLEFRISKNAKKVSRTDRKLGFLCDTALLRPPAEMARDCLSLGRGHVCDVICEQRHWRWT